jgi:hypothetical protein
MKHLIAMIPLGFLVLLGAISALVPADIGSATSTSADYDLSWWTVDAGGGASNSNDGYVLAGIAGQPDVGPALSGNGYLLSGGFWGSASVDKPLFLPLVLRNVPQH